QTKTNTKRRGYPGRDALIFCLLLILLPAFFSLPGCNRDNTIKYSDSFTGTFDTVIQIIAYTDSDTQFQEWVSQAETRFRQLHKLFDIYHEYEGLNNLFTVNEMAGIQPVVVDQELIDLLMFFIDMDQSAPGAVNIAFGPVLSIWHDYRTSALDGGAVAVPDQELLEAASLLCNLDKVIIDTGENTVFLQEAGMQLDVGAIAKGYATELVARDLIAAGMTSGIISAGGSNVRLIGKPADERSTWQIGLQNPDSNPLIPDEPPLDVLLVNDQSIVTSGDYQRYYEVDGVIYHHLIDTKTLQPARHFRAVTVMTPDSARADFLSTALFLLPIDQGLALVNQLGDCEVLWIFPDNRIEATDGMRAHLKSAQGN
ncbi:MAG: FAD:protein FMN transferase, partial [Bacillota bacterium]|nr:FAD:protein FMN transferase [Bacillota bacterium]